MFENELQTRCAICGTGILLGFIFVLAHLPLILLMFPVTVLFLGIVADPDETHAVWYGMMNTLGIFDVSTLSNAENENYTREKHYFWFGEVMMAGNLAGSIAVPAGGLRDRPRSPWHSVGLLCCFSRSLCSCLSLSSGE